MLDTPQQLHTALKLTIKHFILVMDALGDREMKWLSTGSHWNQAVNEATAYGYTAPSNIRLIPTSREISQAEIVGSWLTWLAKFEGERSVKRLVEWAHDKPMWRMAEHEDCSVKTVANRIDRSVQAILKQFGQIEAGIAEIEERPDKPLWSFATPCAVTEAGVRSGGHPKVWIDGVGYMIDGRRWNDGRAKADKFKAA
jgi:hypothetical protein